MKIRGNTIGTPIKPDKTLVKAQNLTKAEKQQARENIDAVSIYDVQDEISKECVVYSEEMNLSEEAKARVRRNIEAAPFQVVNQMEQDMENILLPLADSALTVGVQEWSAKQKAQARENIGAISEPQLDEVIDYIADNCVQYTQAGSELTESQKANARQNIDAVSYSELMAVENNIDDLDSKVGDIEAALDAIIALQNNIINGYVVPAALNDEGGDGV